MIAPSEALAVLAIAFIFVGLLAGLAYTLKARPRHRFHPIRVVRRTRP